MTEIYFYLVGECKYYFMYFFYFTSIELFYGESPWRS